MREADITVALAAIVARQRLGVPPLPVDAEDTGALDDQLPSLTATQLLSLEIDIKLRNVWDELDEVRGSWDDPDLEIVANAMRVAFVRGRSLGETTGESAGYHKGYEEGYDEGHAAGMDEGYEEAHSVSTTSARRR